MKPKEVVLFVFDEEQHYKDNMELLGENTFKRTIRINSFEDLEKELLRVDDEEYIYLVVHAFYTNKIRGIQRYATSGIKDKYPLIGELYISEGITPDIQKNMIDIGLTSTSNVCQYYQVRKYIENDEVKVYIKKDVINGGDGKILSVQAAIMSKMQNIQIDYALITALEEDEMEKVLPMIEREGKISDSVHLIEYGHFKANPEKKIAYASQLSTGMIDAAILATEMLMLFKPKFLIMTGVLGGKPDDTNIGDIVVSTKVFTVDKGKYDKGEFKPEIESSNADSKHITSFKRDVTKIKRFIEDENVTRKRDVNIHFEPVACVRQVINTEGYFAEKIIPIERKTIALEMESYGIARACEIVNNKQTVPIIIKSVMDNTQDKVDDAKTYAAWTSAKFLEYIIVKDLI